MAEPLMVSRAIEQALEATAVTMELHRAFVTLSHPALESERVHTSIPLADEPMTIRAQDLDRLQRCAVGGALAIDREPLVVERLGCAGNGFEGVRDPRGLAATRLLGSFHIVTIPMAARRAVVQAVESAGLEVARLIYTAPALLASVGEARGRQRLLLIDAGGLTTDVALFADGVLRASAVIPSGGVTLARSIARELRVTMDQALTWSLEGAACKRAEVRELVERQWTELQGTVESLLAGQARPDAMLLAGRGSLLDGFAEWAERITKIKTEFARSPRTSRAGDLGRQLGVSAAIGILELVTQGSEGLSLTSPHLFDRLIDRTRTILTEYF
jgi:cell division ATPase FtsA